MATATVTKLINGTKRDVIHVTVVGDGSDITQGVIYDYSADTYAPAAATKLWVESITPWMDGTGSFELYWDGGTDFFIWGAPQYQPGNNIDFTCFGGIGNKATTPTGDLTMNTTSLGSGDHMGFVIVIRKA